MDTNTLYALLEKERQDLVMQHLYGMRLDFHKAMSFYFKQLEQTQEIDDIFTETLIHFMDKVIEGEIILENDSILFYLRGIAINLIKKNYKKRSKEFAAAEIFTYLCEDSEWELSFVRERSRLMDYLEHCLQDLGQRYQMLIRAIFYEELSVEDLIKRFDYANAESVYRAKYKALLKLKERLKNYPK
ncbi:sigma-70 family RNA polymerase sigma factor [Hugenholtzia roseola]|uniref:sigma-70 family RNA polymerase sigma factor n=1 Tax=Hugenholtzia roseola TaxID=1002 RepID=UPI00042A2378|nr:sigma-70 family RNA polymerase sigma factor [Hugenholtzia roseola]